MEALTIALVGAAMLVIVGGLGLALFVKARVRVPPGFALVVHGSGRESRVSFADSTVIPFIARGELIDCSVHTIAVACEGKDAVRCYDRVRADVRAEFMIAINRTADDVLKVVQSLGTRRAGDREALQELFAAKFGDAIATVLAQFHQDELHRRRDELRDKVIEVIGTDLNGFVLQDMAFTRLEQLPLEMHDPGNVLDAEAIVRITERTSRDLLRKQEIELDLQMQVARRKLDVEEATLNAQLAFERSRPDR
ncbi:MAG TPA: SPFH domain-containing protein [Nannocystaceae bacterium]|nr:SPFH domain-containing protein [Nannocystaceae bacterium]